MGGIRKREGAKHITSAFYSYVRSISQPSQSPLPAFRHLESVLYKTMGSIDPRLPKSWNDILVEDWQAFMRLITGKSHIVIDGSSLSVASIVATSRYAEFAKSINITQD
jgi:hypothetical protein